MCLSKGKSAFEISTFFRATQIKNICAFDIFKISKQYCFPVDKIFLTRFASVHAACWQWTVEVVCLVNNISFALAHVIHDYVAETLINAHVIHGWKIAETFHVEPKKRGGKSC